MGEYRGTAGPYALLWPVRRGRERGACCVSGEEADCGAASGPCGSPEAVEEWQRRHTRDTRHVRCRRSFTGCAVLEPEASGRA